jgi:hypothetical protein
VSDLDAMLGHEASAEASVKQGMELRDIARKRNWTNREFESLVTMPGEGPRTIDLDGLTLTVLGPNQERIDKLQADWARALRKKDRAEAAALIADEALDTSVTNLSSIIVLAELGGRRMLLTGDALGLHVIDGLRHAKLLDRDGRFRVDLLKLPHHGSDRNNPAEFFRTILADHYVVSADGRDGNPDLKTFRALVEARGDDVYTIHVTNDHDKNNKPLVAVEFLKDQQKDGRRFRLNVLPKGQASFVIDPSAATATKPVPKAAEPAKPKAPKRPKAARPKRSG